jgi:hypothetical protein
LRQQQEAFDSFLEEYNFTRPHEALGMKKPGAVYQSSELTYTPKTAPMKYLPEFIARQVRSSGEIVWHCKRIYVSQALAGEYIGLFQLDDEHKWEINFGFQKLGILDDQSCIIKV